MERAYDLDAASNDSQPSEEITVVRRSVAPRPQQATRVEIDVQAIIANMRDVQARVGPSRGVFAMLKADAYGHGLVPVGRALAEDGVAAGLIVTSVPDGLSLRREKIICPVVLMGNSYAGAHCDALDLDLVPVLMSMADLEAFAQAARSRGRPVNVHVKIDTGMSRLGLAEEDIGPFLDVAAQYAPHIAIVGLCTHFTSADSDPETTERQLQTFEGACARFRAAGHRPSMLHAANTAATFRHPRTHFSHVRAGIALFGGDVPSGVRLRPALRLVTQVAQDRWVPGGQSVSYGGKWRAPRPSRIAILPIGYGHGYPRRLAGRGHVLIRGRRCPIVSVCMEMTLVDVTELDTTAGAGEEAVLIGADGGDEIRATELAEVIDGIVEEILCALPKALPRAYSARAASRPGWRLDHVGEEMEARASR